MTNKQFNGVFWKLPNLKKIIFVDGGTGKLVYSNTPIDTVIFNASGDKTVSGTASVAAQQAGAKALIADMNLPDWALAFLPAEVGGTEKACTIDEVFNFSISEMLSNWGGSSEPVEETSPVTQPTYTTDSPQWTDGLLRITTKPKA